MMADLSRKQPLPGGKLGSYSVGGADETIPPSMRIPAS